MLHLVKELQQRELNGRKNKLRLWLDEKIEDNIYKNTHITKTIYLSSPICVAGYHNHFVAILDENKLLSLWDISIQERLWSFHIEDLDGYVYDHERGLIVSQAGLVLYISRKEDAYYNNYPHIQIFSDGKWIGCFTIQNPDFLLSSIQIVNNRIFGISRLFDMLMFYEWNTQGNCVRELSLNHFKQACHITIDVSDDYYIVAAFNEFYKEGVKRLTIFIFDLHKNNARTFNFFETELVNTNIVISSIYILNNTLLIGLCYKGFTCQHSFKIFKTPHIRTIDIETGRFLHQDMSIGNDGQIKQLVASGRYIIFLIYDNKEYQDRLYCINQATKAMQIIKLPSSISCMDLLDMHIYLNRSMLIMCYSSGCRMGEERYVVNLDTEKILQAIKYNRGLFCAPFFARFSKNVFFRMAADRTTIHIEDFYNTKLNDEEPSTNGKINYCR